MALLSSRKVDTLKGDLTKDELHNDGNGLYLKIAKGTGSKSWALLYTYAGRRKRYTLGSYPELSLAEARERATECRGQVERGLDPMQVGHRQDQEKREAKNVEELIVEFRLRYLNRHYKRPEEAEAMLRRDLKPLFKTLVPDVTPKDIVRVVNRILDRGAKVAANRFLNLTKRLFHYAKSQHYIVESPVQLTRSGAGGRELSRTTNLTFKQLGMLYRLLLDPPMNFTRRLAWQTVAALRLQILTGQRPGEVVMIEWDELDLKAGIWIIPAERTKVPANGDHTVHLSKQAVALLQEIKERRASLVYVFPSPDKRCEGQPIKRKALGHAMRSMREMGMIEFEFTPHDLRRTFATRMGELEQEPHIVEKVLNHKMEGVMAVYNRFEYLPQRAAALQLWGDEVEKTVSSY